MSREYEIVCDSCNSRIEMEALMNSSLGGGDDEVFIPSDVGALCKTKMPSAYDLAHGITGPLMACLTVAACVTFLTVSLFWRQFPEIRKRTPKQFLSHTVVLCGLYQVRIFSDTMTNEATG